MTPLIQGVTVAIYFVDLAYGGPEEGGWYYETGDLDLIYPEQYFPHRENAASYRRLLQRQLDATLNKDLRPLSSVRSEGRYQARVYEGALPPLHYPHKRPHYE